jgi:glycosyltransferase involved in cell wall biosynthesis
MPVCYQVNLQTCPGGGEIYTRFFTDALASLGWENVLVVARGARFWESMQLPARLVPIAEGHQLEQVLPSGRSVVVTQNVLGRELARAIAARHVLGGVVHMPFHGRDPAGLPFYARVFGVSRYVLASLAGLGLESSIHPDPMYGIADLRPRDTGCSGPLAEGAVYDWDRRKFRDRVLATLEPLLRSGSRAEAFSRRPGTAFGIVSRLTPIKQFPLMFSLLAPQLARHPGMNLEIFGSGGYASVRDLKRALQPVAPQVRFWGHQSDVAPAYKAVDYVLSGLPEKEALGLNLVEAQASGTPVLAVNAAPFVESVLDGVTGHLFEDPRNDGGDSFASLLTRIAAGTATLDREGAARHLARFSETAFQERVARAMAALAGPAQT